MNYRSGSWSGSGSGSSSGSSSGSRSFRQDANKKSTFYKVFFTYYLGTVGTLKTVIKDKKSLRSQKTLKIKVLLNFLLMELSVQINTDPDPDPWDQKMDSPDPAPDTEHCKKLLKKKKNTIDDLCYSLLSSKFSLGPLRQPECEPRGQLHRRNHPGREKLHPAAAPRIRHRGVRAGGEQPARDCAAPVRVWVQRGRTGQLRHLHRGAGHPRLRRLSLSETLSGGGSYKKCSNFFGFSTYPTVAKGKCHVMDIFLKV